MESYYPNCPICNAKCSERAELCSECGFEDKFGISAVWINPEDAKAWFEAIVKPFRREWDLRKKQDELFVKISKLEVGLIGELKKIRQQALVNPKKPSLGSIMEFGGYDWRVLDVHINKVLLLSEKVLSVKIPYHERKSDPSGESTNTSVKDLIESKAFDTTWEQCSLRQYLNNEFYNRFGLSDRKKIMLATTVNNRNPWYGTNGGNNVIDNIFLLSLEEVVLYFGDSGQMGQRPGTDIHWIDDQFNDTRMACTVARKNFTSLREVSIHWWLRSPGSSGLFVAFVGADGNIAISGSPMGTIGCGLRPALWLSL